MAAQKTTSSGFDCDYKQCKTSCFMINHILAYRCMIDGQECAYRMRVSGHSFCTHASRNDFSAASPS